MSLKILTEPNHLLQMPSQSVEFPLSKDVKKLAIEILEYVKMNKGAAGLAAPQVGYSLRIFAAKDDNKITTLMINPHVVMTSKDSVHANEGCLSIPGKLYDVPRSSLVTLRYQDLKGKYHEVRVKGWYSRVLQHELDHLDGVLISKRGVEVVEDI